MNRIDRLFGILILLQSKRYVPAEMIAEQFNISLRTVYRDLKALCEQGIPLVCEPSKGYSVMQGYYLSPVSFTTEEANALLLMESIVEGFADRSIRNHYTSALIKVKAVLKSSQKESVEVLSNSTLLQKPACLDFSFEYLSDIQKAITSRKILELEYKNSAGEPSHRRVEPIGLIFYALNWHLIAWCHVRKEYRDFKVPRIQKLQLSNDTFTISDHMEVKEYMKELPVNY